MRGIAALGLWITAAVSGGPRGRASGQFGSGFAEARLLSELLCSHGTAKRISGNEFRIDLEGPPTASVALLARTEGRYAFARDGSRASALNLNGTALYDGSPSTGGANGEHWLHENVAVSMRWDGLSDSQELVSRQREIPLPDDLSERIVDLSLRQRRPLAAAKASDGASVNVTVAGGGEAPVEVVTESYKVRIKPSQVLPTFYLRSIEGYDEETGANVLVKPSFFLPSVENTVFEIYADPASAHLQLRVECSHNAVTKIDNRVVPQDKGFVRITRDKTRHTQLLSVSCDDSRINTKTNAKSKTSNGGIGGMVTRSFAIQIMSDPNEIQPPRLLVPSAGGECKFDAEKQRYECPSGRPRPGTSPAVSGDSASRHLRLLSLNDPTIKYLAVSADNTVAVRLANGIISIPFELPATSLFSKRPTLFLRAIAGRKSATWPIAFDQQSSASTAGFRWLGFFINSVLSLLALAFFLVLGVAGLSSIGYPLGATEILSSLAFLIQFLIFTTQIFTDQQTAALNGDTLNGGSDSGILAAIARPMRHLTLFAPLPSFLSSRLLSKLLNLDDNNTWDSGAIPGDVLDVRNAFGALFYACALFGLLLIARALTAFKFAVLQRDHTVPHRLAWGNYESHVMHFLVFPVFVAGAVILSAPLSAVSYTGKAAAGLVIFASLLFLGLFSVAVASVVRSEKVVWAWEQSVREDGPLEDEGGRWMDVTNDQLLTQPTNRSLCRTLFPFMWVSAVADIVPQTLPARPGMSHYPPKIFSAAPHKQLADYVNTKNPFMVTVLRTRSPKSIFSSRHLVAGLFRTKWLDVLMTYEALTNLVSLPTPRSTVPLLIKIGQLAGPITHGYLAFFFDGVRAPFVRIGDSFYRLAVGLAVGLAISSQLPKCHALSFFTITLLSLILFAYILSTRPYSRVLENHLVAVTLAVIAVASASFAGFAALARNPQTLTAAALYLVVLACLTLSAYSLFVTATFATALLMPPLDESRFLHRLANCSLSLASSTHKLDLHEVPASTKFALHEFHADLDLSARMGKTKLSSLRRNLPCADASAGAPKQTRFQIRPFKLARILPTLTLSADAILRACRNRDLPAPALIVYAPSEDPAQTFCHRSFTQEQVNDAQSLVAELQSFFLHELSLPASQAHQISTYIAKQKLTRKNAIAVLKLNVFSDDRNVLLCN